MNTDAPVLHAIERAILRALSRRPGASVQVLAEITHLDADQVRRGIEWLKSKSMISVLESSVSVISLDRAGREASRSGLPERRLVDAIKEGKTTMAGILASGRLKKEEASAAIAAAKQNKWIKFSGGGEISLMGDAEPSTEELLLKRLQQGGIEIARLTEQERHGLNLLGKRPDYVVQKEVKDVRVSLTDTGRNILPSLTDDIQTEARLTSDMLASGKWRNVNLGALDVEAPAPIIFPGRWHPLVDIIEEIREIFVGLGFVEIDGPLVESGFWNFDALFIPQEHPAREMQDTFYVTGRRQEILATRDQKRKVARVHKIGWGLEWDEMEAKRMVLRTHTTPVTLRHLAASKPETGRFFSVGRVFRNEKPSYKHLAEFHQVEGVATARSLSLCDLMGLQKEFYARMGIKKVKFWPTFFPYTEPSLQSMVYNEGLQKWVELFGMGIFRPQVTRPLGIKNPVLAWGGGIERIAMLRYGLDDVRELYSSKLTWLRSLPRCQL